MTETLRNDKSRVHYVAKQHVIISREVTFLSDFLSSKTKIVGMSLDIDKVILEDIDEDSLTFRKSEASSDSKNVSEPQVEENLSEVDIKKFMLTPNDSQDPSYTNLSLPYRVICRRRLAAKAKEMQDQFAKELMEQQRLQDTALGGIKLQRIFCRPPSNVIKNDIIRLTKKQQFRLQKLMKEPI